MQGLEQDLERAFILLAVEKRQGCGAQDRVVEEARQVGGGQAHAEPAEGSQRQKGSPTTTIPPGFVHSESARKVGSKPPQIQLAPIQQVTSNEPAGAS